MRAPGQVERLQDIHDLPVILLHGPSTGLGSNSTPERTRGGAPDTDRHAARPRTAQGDQLSANREMRCPPTGRLTCPLSAVARPALGYVDPPGQVGFREQGLPLAWLVLVR